MIKKSRPDRWVNSDGAKGSSSHNTPYHQKSQSDNGAISQIVLRRCAASDEWLVVLPDYAGVIVVLIARTRELRSYRRLCVIALEKETRVLQWISERRWRVIRALAGGVRS